MDLTEESMTYAHIHGSIQAMKTCPKCLLEKSLDEFHSKASKCKVCANAATAEWRERNREKHREYSKQYCREHPEENKQRAAQWVQENKERFNKKCLEWRKAHPLNAESKVRKNAATQKWQLANKESRATYSRAYAAKNAARISEKRKQYYAEKKEVIAGQHKLWLTKNKDAIREYNKQYTKNRYYADAIFRLKMEQRNRIRNALKENKKSAKTDVLLGCSFDFLRGYIEGKFTDGMTWENMGAWHVDHIAPLVSFDLSGKEGQQRAFHYSNLQPLWAIDNLRKGAKRA